MDNFASMAWGARNLISTQVRNGRGHHLRARHQRRAPAADFFRSPRHVGQPSASRTAPDLDQLHVLCTGDARAVRYSYARADAISDAGADAGPLAGAHARALREADAPADAAALSGAYRRTERSSYT